MSCKLLNFEYIEGLICCVQDNLTGACLLNQNDKHEAIPYGVFWKDDRESLVSIELPIIFVSTNDGDLMPNVFVP